MLEQRIWKEIVIEMGIFWVAEITCTKFITPWSPVTSFCWDQSHAPQPGPRSTYLVSLHQRL